MRSRNIKRVKAYVLVTDQMWGSSEDKMSPKFLTCTIRWKGGLSLRSMHWKKTRFRGKDHASSVGFTEFEIILKHSSAEVEAAVGYMGLKFRGKIWTRILRLSHA